MRYSVFLWVICFSPVYADWLSSLWGILDGHSRLTSQTNRLPWTDSPTPRQAAPTAPPLPPTGIEFVQANPPHSQPMQLPEGFTFEEYQRLDPAIQDELRRTTFLPLPAGARPDINYQELARHAAVQPSYTEVPKLRGNDPFNKIVVVKHEKDVPGYVDENIQTSFLQDPIAYSRKHYNDYFYPQTPEEKEAARERAIRAANNGELVTYITPKNHEEQVRNIYRRIRDQLGSGVFHEFGQDYVFPEISFVRPNVNVPPRPDPIRPDRGRPRTRAPPPQAPAQALSFAPTDNSTPSAADSEDLSQIEQDRLRSMRIADWQRSQQLRKRGIAGKVRGEIL